MKRLIGLLILIFAWNAGAENLPIDQVAIAAVLVNDGRFEQAKSLLSQINLQDKEIDLRKYHRTFGLCEMGLKNYQNAREHFLIIVKEDGKVLPFLAQVELELRNPQAALKWLEKMKEPSSANTFLVKFRVHRELEQDEMAFETLNQGLAFMPGNKKLTLQKVEFLLEKSVVAGAMKSVTPFLSRQQVVDEDFIHIARSFKKFDRNRSVERLLQWGLLRFPYSEKLNLELSFFFVESDRMFSAFQVLSKLAGSTGEFNKEAAELARRLGKYDQALFYNSRIVNQAEKFKQRLSIAIDMERYDIAVAMTEKLDRLDLLKTDEVRYAIAFSHYRLRDYVTAESFLSQLTSNQFFEQALNLRQAMNECAEVPVLCM